VYLNPSLIEINLAGHLKKKHPPNLFVLSLFDLSAHTTFCTAYEALGVTERPIESNLGFHDYWDA
jgi:hypothetical protein